MTSPVAPTEANVDEPHPASNRKTLVFTRERMAALAGAALVVLLVGYWAGWSAGRDTLDHAGTSSAVMGDQAGPGAGGDTTTSGQAPSTAVPSTTLPEPLVVPSVQPITVDFASGLPAKVAGRQLDVVGPWTGRDGTLQYGDLIPPFGANDQPPNAEDAPHVLVDAGTAPVLASVVLSAPSGLSGLVTRYRDRNNYWAALVDAKRTHVTLIEVLDGAVKPRGFVNVAVVPGTTLGLFVTDDTIGIQIDGQPKVLGTFYGPRAGLGTDGIDGTKIGVVAGDGAPGFDDLSFG